jgi:hypothetical protein
VKDIVIGCVRCKVQSVVESNEDCFWFEEYSCSADVGHFLV